MAMADYASAIILDPGNVTALTQRGAIRYLLGAWLIDSAAR